MKYTLGTASKATGKAKSTILRAIKSGTITATKADDGSYEIDPSELHRVFSSTVATTTLSNATQPSDDPHITAVLETENLALKAALEREREVNADLREDREKWRQQATALLASPPRRKGWWPW